MVPYRDLMAFLIQTGEQTTALIQQENDDFFHEMQRKKEEIQLCYYFQFFHINALEHTAQSHLLGNYILEYTEQIVRTYLRTMICEPVEIATYAIDRQWLESGAKAGLLGKLQPQ